MSSPTIIDQIPMRRGTPASAISCIVLTIALLLLQAPLTACNDASNGRIRTRTSKPDSDSDQPFRSPSWFLPFYWTVLILISTLGAITKAGQFHVSTQTSTFHSIITLIVIDSLAYLNIFLSAFLVIVSSAVSKPWQSITVTFVAPMTALIVSVIFGLSMQLHERRILTLWLRSATLLSVDHLTVEIDSLQSALLVFKKLHHSINTEDQILALMRTNRPGGVASAARNKGSARPFVTAVHTWLRSGDPPRLPRAFVMTRIGRVKRPRWITRHINTKQAMEALQISGRNFRRQTHMPPPANAEQVTIVSSLDGCVRRTPCPAFGRMWLRAAREPGLGKKSEGWWLIGADIVQSLKSCFGLRYLTEPDHSRFDDVKALWDWVDSLGYGWRKEFQLRDVAGELARAAREDESVVIEKALFMADEGTDVPTSNLQYRLALEANAVSCLGLAVRVTISELQYRLEDLSERFEEILQRVGEEVVGIWIVREPWPEAEIAQLMFRWVGEAAVAMGRVGGPGVNDVT